MKITFIILLLFIPIISSALNLDDKYLYKLIDFGYTTRWDIEQALGKGEYLNKKYLYPELENQFQNKSLSKQNASAYPNLGLTFFCYSDLDYIAGIKFSLPYKGLFGQKDSILLGTTKVKNAFPNFESIDYNTTIASSYWSFKIGNYLFYVEKPDKYKGTGFIPNKENFEEFGNLPIKIITTVIDDYSSFDKYNILYAPKSETHINVIEQGWPKHIPFYLIPLYAMTGGGKSEKIKQGYWKEYSPRHLLAYEGEFVDGEKSGLFKYYDENGKLARTEEYSKIHLPWVSIIICAIIILIITWLVIRKFKKISVQN